jgi:carboxypeptidase Q
MADRGSKIVVRLKMEAHFDPDVESANVVGEIRGRERPDEVVVVSGHLDSWDVGAGATDDGGGCVVTWEALRIMKKLNLRPRRTVRVVLWTNEENGGRGGLAYRDQHRAELSNVMMMESDGGVFRPLGFGFSATTGRATPSGHRDAPDRHRRRSDLTGRRRRGHRPERPGSQIPAMSLDVEGSVLLVHHTPADTIDKIDPTDMVRCAAAVAVMAYVIADLPCGSVPRSGDLGARGVSRAIDRYTGGP